MSKTDRARDGATNSKLEEAAELIREHADEHGDEDARDLARMVELGEYRATTEREGRWLRGVQRDTHRWRMETIGEGVTPMSQAAHASVEAGEVLDILVKAETYDESWLDDNRGELEEEIGDVIVALAGVPALLGLDIVECVNAALDKNGARNWDGWQTQVADFGEGHADD